MPILFICTIVLLAYLVVKRKPRKKGRRDWLDYVLFFWPTGDPFTRRDLMRSVSVYGITGSGKTSGSGKHFLDSIIADPLSTLFIVAQKPEDREFFEGIFKRHGKSKKLLVVDKSCKYRCNLFDDEMRDGADVRGLTDFVVNLGDALQAGTGRGGDNDRFWRMLEQRIIYNAIGAVRLGSDKLTAPVLRDFLTMAPYTEAQLSDIAWQGRVHNQIMQAAAKASKGDIDAADFENFRAFWTTEFPTMDDKPRSSGMAGVMNTFHVFNTGLVRKICSTDTTISPSVMEDGYSTLINFPFVEDGPTGRFVAGGFRRRWQNYILRRKGLPGGFYNVQWLDEYQESTTEFDSLYLAMCRSHLGCMFTLTQTVNSQYSAMGGAGVGQHKVDALQSNFGHRVYHTVDDLTAEKAVKLTGKNRETFISVSGGGGQRDLYDQMYGDSGFSSSFSEQYQSPLKAADLMRQKTGGPASGFKVGGCVIRLGEPFADGQSFQFVEFDQR